MSKKENFSGEELNAFLDQGSEFEGKLVFKGVVRIDGLFKGEIISDDHLVIGDTGVIEGTVRVGTMKSSGKIKGKVIAKEKIEFLAPGRMDGEIQTPRISIEDGFIFNGTCKMDNFQDEKLIAEEEES